MIFQLEPRKRWDMGVVARNNQLDFWIRKEIWVFQKYWYPKMDGETNGKPYEQMDDLGIPLFLETPNLEFRQLWNKF